MAETLHTCDKKSEVRVVLQCRHFFDGVVSVFERKYLFVRMFTVLFLRQKNEMRMKVHHVRLSRAKVDVSTHDILCLEYKVDSLANVMQN